MTKKLRYTKDRIGEEGKWYKILRMASSKLVGKKLRTRVVILCKVCGQEREKRISEIDRLANKSCGCEQNIKRKKDPNDPAHIRRYQELAQKISANHKQRTKKYIYKYCKLI